MRMMSRWFARNAELGMWHKTRVHTPYDLPLLFPDSIGALQTCRACVCELRKPVPVTRAGQ
jgi:hypothetical protein